jgi:hypothetical protein
MTTTLAILMGQIMLVGWGYLIAYAVVLGGLRLAAWIIRRLP